MEALIIKNKNLFMKRKIYASILLGAMLLNVFPYGAFASSHREAPLIANDPLADNTDLYAFRSPDDPNKITIIACYVPGQLPQGGPNYYSFGENIRYEIHVDNNVATQTVMILLTVLLLKKKMKTLLHSSISGWENKI